MDKRNLLNQYYKVRRAIDTYFTSEEYEFKKKRFIFKNKLKDFNRRNPCIFVLSTGRVGSQTLAALLKIPPNIISLHEPNPSLYALSRYSYQNEIAKDNQIFNQIVYDMRADKVERCLKYGVGYVETSPQSTFLAPYLSQLVPDLKFIHLIRNPVSVICSGMRRGWYAGNPYDKYRITPRVNTNYYSEWKKFSQFQKNVWLWAETNRWVFEYSKETKNELLCMEAEDIFAKKEQSLKDLYNFCGSSVPPMNKINRILSKKLNSQLTGDFPGIEGWSVKQIRQFKSITSDLLLDTPYIEKLQKIERV